MKLCRELFPTLLEQEGLLTEILTSSFSANSGTLYEDIMQNGLEDEFKNHIYNKVDVEKNKLEIIEEKNSTNIENFQLPGYIVANDGKYYKFNMERNGIYYCPGNIIIENGEPKQLENPEAQILIDYFILDMKNKTIKLYDDKWHNDSFIDYFENLAETDAKIKIEKNKEKETREITIQKKQDESITIEIDENNEIIGYNNPY